MTHFEGLFDTQLHVELLQHIAAYQSQGVQVSELLPPFISDMLTRNPLQEVSALFPADPEQVALEQSLEALRLFSNKGWIALTYRGDIYPAEVHVPDIILTQANQDRFVATITGLGRTYAETGVLPSSQLPRAAAPQPSKAPRNKGAGSSGLTSIVALVRRKAQRYAEPKSEAAALKHMVASIAGRRGQQAFRQQLLGLYQHCLVTGCNAEETLEAAHIQAYSAAGTFEVSNGLLLRADIHTLFDLGFLTIETSTMTVQIAKALSHTVYGALHGIPLRFPPRTAHIPNRHALDMHRAVHAHADAATLL